VSAATPTAVSYQTEVAVIIEKQAQTRFHRIGCFWSSRFLKVNLEIAHQNQWGRGSRAISQKLGKSKNKKCRRNMN
jgi:hypothetical protein